MRLAISMMIRVLAAAVFGAAAFAPPASASELAPLVQSNHSAPLCIRLRNPDLQQAGGLQPEAR